MKKKVTINLPAADADRLAEVLDAFPGASEHLVAVLSLRIGLDAFGRSPARFKKMHREEMLRRASARRGQ